MEENKKQFIENIKTNGRVSSTFLVTRKESKKDKNNNMYIDLELQDRTGKISAKIWTDAIEKTDSFKKKDVVFVEGEAKDNNYGKQIIVRSLKKINDEKIDYEEYDFKSKYLPLEYRHHLEKDLLSFIKKVENIHLKKLLEVIFGDKDFLKKFCNSTAAVKNHHASVGGLLEHSVSVCRICEFIAKSYNTKDKMIDSDLLYCGAILHDIGKTIGYSVENFLDINDEENLISHISLGFGIILEHINKIPDFPEKLKQNILHIILSHHGEKEFGSPIEPQILESIIVYNADRMDADINHYTTSALESIEDETWQYSNYFRRRILLKKPESDTTEKENPIDFNQEKLI